MTEGRRDRHGERGVGRIGEGDHHRAAPIHGLGRGQPESGRIVGGLAARDFGRRLGGPRRLGRDRGVGGGGAPAGALEPEHESADHEHRGHGTGPGHDRRAARPAAGTAGGEHGVDVDGTRSRGIRGPLEVLAEPGGIRC